MMNNHNEIIISDNVTILLSLFTHFNFDSVLYHTYTDIASYHIPTVSLPIPGADPEILRKLELYISYHGSQPAHDVPGTSPEGPLKVLTSGTSRGPSGDS